MVDININVPTIDLTDVDLTDLETEDTTPLSTIGMSDSQVATSLGLEYTGDRDQDQMVQDAVDQARRDTMMAEGTYPSEAEIAERTAQFEATMEQLRTDPAMREAWGIDRDTRRFSISQILAVAASFAIPFASPAIASAIGLVGPAGVAVTQGTLSAALAAVTGGDPLTAFITGGASGYLSELDKIDSLLTGAQGANEAQTIANINAISNAVQTADQATTAWDVVKNIYDVVQDVSTAQNIYNAIRRDNQDEALDSEAPEDILDLRDTTEEVPPEEVISEDVVSDLEADQQETIETVDEAPAAEEDLLAEDEDLLGTTDVFVQVEEGAEDGDPFFPDPIDFPELDSTQDIDFETPPLDPIKVDPFETEEEAGGGGATDATEAADTGEAADATDEAVEATDATQTDVTSTTDDSGEGGMLTGGEDVQDRPFALPNGPWVYIGNGRWVQIDPDVLAQEGVVTEDEEGKFVVDVSIYENDDNWVRTAEDPTWNPDNPEVYDVGDTGDILGSGEPYVPEEETVTEEDVIDIFLPTGTEEVTTVPTEEVTTVPTEEVTEEIITDTVDTATVGTGDGTGVSDTGTAEGGDVGTGAGDVGDTTTVGTGAGTEGTGDEGDGVEGIGTDGTGEGDGGDGTGDGTGDGAPVSAGGMFSPKPFQGYMGGLSYQLPEFVGVYYQPRDYDVELNRIIQQSLFQGMY